MLRKEKLKNGSFGRLRQKNSTDGGTDHGLIPEVDPELDPGLILIDEADRGGERIIIKCAPDTMYKTIRHTNSGLS